MVGTSGSTDERLVALTAKATTLPERISSSADGIGVAYQSSRPAMTSRSASLAPLNGTCWTSIPALMRMRSPARCVAEPMPPEP